MGSGRGDRNQLPNEWIGTVGEPVASMGSGRGDRNQRELAKGVFRVRKLASMGSGRGDRNQFMDGARERPGGRFTLQWGPVVVTGISRPPRSTDHRGLRRFNGVRSW